MAVRTRTRSRSHMCSRGLSRCKRGRVVSCMSSRESMSVVEGRRRALAKLGCGSTGVAMGMGVVSSPPASLAADFAVVQDAKKGYVFAYPFGWQEVQVDGQEAVYKDVIESLESLNLTISDTEKKSIDEYGDAARTANLFLEKVLTSPATTSSYKLLESRESELEGYKYYQLEYEMNLKADMRGGGGRPPPKRHVVTTCVIGNEKLYLLTVGTVDRRWPKMGERLRKVANSLKLLY